MISLDNIDIIIARCVDYAKIINRKEIVFVWHGGEPLTYGLNNFIKIVEMQKQYSEIKFINKIQTNATLINDAWCEFFKENHFKIGISFDSKLRCVNTSLR